MTINPVISKIQDSLSQVIKLSESLVTMGNMTQEAFAVYKSARDTKDLVNQLVEIISADPNIKPYPFQHNGLRFSQQTVAYMLANLKVSAIKEVRADNNLPLKEAKDAVIGYMMRYMPEMLKGEPV
jgi:ribosomal protein L7/L12